MALLGPHSGGTSRNPDLPPEWRDEELREAARHRVRPPVPPGLLDARDATVDTRPDPIAGAWVHRG